jgi:hypothetical protein
MSNLEKTYFNLEQDDVQENKIINSIPDLVFSFVIGILIDTVPIFGSRRKSYVIIFSILQLPMKVLFSFYKIKEN